MVLQGGEFSGNPRGAEVAVGAPESRFLLRAAERGQDANAVDNFPIEPASRERLERLGEDFLIEFLRRDTQRHPKNALALAELAHRLTSNGRIEEGLDVDRRLVRLQPDEPIVHYNLGCSLALLGRTDEALDALERSIELGFANPGHLESDEDLASLRDEVRFRDLVRRLNRERPDLSSR